MGNTVSSSNNDVIKTIRQCDFEKLEYNLTDPSYSTKFLNEVDHKDNNALITACHNIGAECLKVLLTTGVDVNLVDHAGRTALSYSCENCSWNLSFVE